MNAPTSPPPGSASPDPAAAPEDAARVLAESDAAAHAQAAATRSQRTRKRWFLVLGAVVLIALVVYLVYRLLFSAATEVTDDAYVAGDVVTVTARDRGTVTAIYADSTQSVRAGDPLIDFDPADADAQVAAAEAQLAQAVRGVRANFARVDEANAQINSADADLARARSDLSRRRAAAAEGAVSAEEVAHAGADVRSAEAALTLARSRSTQASVAVSGATLDANPDVLAAIAAVRRASLVRGHMHLVAPVAGVVAQRSVQLGQQVAAGTPLMAVVPLASAWIDANFRETQLRDLRIGQPVTVRSDVYGGDIVYHGKVIGVSAGSGSAFALLPAQNASGNWIKITQRLPVRVALDPEELRRHPLQIGLSVKVTVDTANAAGMPVTSGAVSAANARRVDAVSAAQDAQTEARIARIIAANRGDGR